MTAAAAQPAFPALAPLLWPREHGAWAMLLLPLLSGLLLAPRLAWECVPAAAVVVGTFILREPLVALWRQQMVWKERRPESEQASRSLAFYLPVIIASGLALVWRLPAVPLLAMGVAAAALTALSVYLTVRNRQRSVLLQLASSAGLNASAWMAWLAAGGSWNAKIIWLLWALEFAHSAAALVGVRARLDAAIASRAGRDSAGRKMQVRVAIAALALTAVASAAASLFVVTVALLFSAAVRAFDLAQLDDAAGLQIPLRRIGRRELLFSTVFSILLVVGLWSI